MHISQIPNNEITLHSYVPIPKKLLSSMSNPLHTFQDILQHIQMRKSVRDFFAAE